MIEAAGPLQAAAGTRRHCLDLDDYSADEIKGILSTADAMQEILARPVRKAPALNGRMVVNCFYEASTRTRVSFEVAAKSLSADVVNITAGGSSVEKGESLIDTAKTLVALGADIIVIRHPMAGAPHVVARNANAAVINAGDGRHAHPTQALLDLYTMHSRIGRLAGLRVAIIGDVLHSRVARSNVHGLTRMGAQVILCGPATLLPANLQMEGLRFEHDLDAVIHEVDVVMPLRIQKERAEGGLIPSLREYRERWGITAERLSRMRRDALIMHPGPMNPGIEIDPEVAVAPASVIESQVTNGVAIRMALLYTLGEATPRRRAAAAASGGARA
ncbi:MAG: aspartate carbamoyltransferase catalytic subunit [Chloroflexi bacterium]|nr:aspartate carbamoyltransferase catalytic subunit [Chloroflexota bacterium]